MNKLTLMTQLFLTFALLLLVSLTALAQQPVTATPSPANASSDSQLLRALLEEVHLLRLEIQKTSINTWRAQAISERISKQQGLVDRLHEESEQLKQQIQSAQDLSREQDDLNELETAINHTPDSNTRAQLTQAYDTMKRSFERRKQYAQEQVQQLSQRQMQIEQTLQVEQSRLAELQEQRDTLDRELEKQIASVVRK